MDAGHLQACDLFVHFFERGRNRGDFHDPIRDMLLEFLSEGVEHVFIAPLQRVVELHVGVDVHRDTIMVDAPRVSSWPTMYTSRAGERASTDRFPSPSLDHTLICSVRPLKLAVGKVMVTVELGSEFWRFVAEAS